MIFYYFEKYFKGNVVHLKSVWDISIFFSFYIQGGSQQLELLNSISRDNYTMLTVKRYTHIFSNKNNKLNK